MAIGLQGNLKDSSRGSGLMTLTDSKNTDAFFSSSRSDDLSEFKEA